MKMFARLAGALHTIVMLISPGTHPVSSPYSSTNMLPKYRKHEWGLVPYTLTIYSEQKGNVNITLPWLPTLINIDISSKIVLIIKVILTRFCSTTTEQFKLACKEALY